jgi:hypothetical protein
MTVRFRSKCDLWSTTSLYGEPNAQPAVANRELLLTQAEALAATTHSLFRQ